MRARLIAAFIVVALLLVSGREPGQRVAHHANVIRAAKGAGTTPIAEIVAAAHDAVPNGACDSPEH